MTPAVERLRTSVACLVVTAAVFAQDSGRQVPDTKLDLSVAPGRWLARALHLWDPLGGAGQLQNQAYGYLFPLGPFFRLAQATGLPVWAVERLWQSLVLCVALLGVRALAVRMGIGTPSTRLLAGLAFALAPRPVSQVGAISVEVWPYALAPWVLVPLVTGATRGSPRRAAALSGLAVLLVGGVNAAATLAVVPLGLLWLLVQAPGPRRRRLLGWWALAVVCATAWWVGPLLLLGRYSPPFLDVIESASTTTFHNGLWSVLTGNDLWLQYLAINGPARPAGYLLVTSAGLVVCVTAIWAVGLWGLVLRDTPHRRFLVGAVLLGVLVVGAGHTGALTGPLAGWERHLLDGVLAPFRNVHKYDVLLRLPLALGLAEATARVRVAGLAAVPRPVALLVAVAVAGAASPVLGSLEPRGSFAELPGYWKDAAAWLDAADHGSARGRAMVVPAASFGDYVWGRPGDEPLQPLARSPWVVRDAVPLGGPGVTRVLDTVEEVLRSGRGSPALAAFLARSGTRFLVVRNDLDLQVTGATRPVVVHAALAASPGLVRVAAFGPETGPGLSSGQSVYDGQLGVSYPAVEVFEVQAPGADEAVATWPTAGTQRVVGGPESVLPLLESGTLGPTGAVRLDGEPFSAGESDELPTLTDGYRDREVDLGRATDGASATLGAGTGRRLQRPVGDYLPVTARGTRAEATVSGMTAVSASSSASDADALLLRGRDHNAMAAFDGEGDTTWVTGDLDPVGQWVEGRFPRTLVTSVRIDVPPVAGVDLVPSTVRVTTDGGSTQVHLVDGSATVPLGVETARLRLTITAVQGHRGGALGVSALEAVVRTPSGPVLAERGLRLARLRARLQQPVAVVLTAGHRDRPGCLAVEQRFVCSPVLPLGDEDDVAIDRTLEVDAAAFYGMVVRVRPRAGDALDALLQQGQPILASASSTAVADPAARAAAVLDRDLRTSWVAAPWDPRPALVLTLARPERLTGIGVAVDPELAASRPRSVGIRVDGGPVTTVALTAAGEAAFPAVTGRRVEVTFPVVEVRTNRRVDGLAERLPVGVTELRVHTAHGDLHQALDPSARLDLPCGQGPSLAVDGRLAATTRVSATVADVLAGRELVATPCAGLPVELAAGSHRVRMVRTGTVQVDQLTFTDLARSRPAAGPSRVQDVPRWDQERRSVDVEAGPPSYLVVHEAFSSGWTARLGGRALTPVRLDGWQQGFLLPASGGRVELRFTPGTTYRLALVLGGVLALLLLLLCGWPAGPGPRATQGSTRRSRWGAVIAVLAVVVAGGAAGGLAVLAAAVLRRRPVWLRVVAPAAVLVAGGLVARDPWPGRALVGAPVQALCLVAVAALAVSVWPPARASDADDEPPPAPSSAAA